MLNLYPPAHAPRVHSTSELARLDDQHQAALEAYAPPSILINEKYAVLHISETAGRYLLQPKGPITTDVLQLVRPELQLELRTALFRVFEKDQAILTQPVAVQFNGHPHRVMLSIHPRLGATEDDKKQEKQALVYVPGR